LHVLLLRYVNWNLYEYKMYMDMDMHMHMDMDMELCPPRTADSTDREVAS